MECSGRLEFEFPGRVEAENALKSMGGCGAGRGRSRVSLRTKGRKLVAEISAPDSVSLRAALNACLRGMKIAEDIEGV